METSHEVKHDSSKAKKLALVLVAGAFSEPKSAFNELLPHLQYGPFDTIKVAPVLSSNPPDPGSADCTKDAEAIRAEVLLPLIEEQSHDVILFTHSYGGLCGGAAAHGLSKSERLQKNQLGGVIGLFYLVGNLVHENSSLLEAVGGQFPPYIKEDTPFRDLSVISPVIETLYGDTPSAMHPRLEKSMTPHATSAFTTSAPPPAWAEKFYGGRRTYIRTLQDKTFPPSLQDGFVAQSGVSWNVIDVDASHGALISRPLDVANLIRQAAEDWR